jgi:hypothetical protein
VLRYVSTSVERLAFQACSFNHSDISPFRINGLRAAATVIIARQAPIPLVLPSPLD